MIKKDISGEQTWIEKNCYIVGLLSSSNLQVTLREDLKGKSGRLKDFCLPVSPSYFLFFFFKRARTNSYAQPLRLYLTIAERKFYRKVCNIFYNRFRC